MKKWQCTVCGFIHTGDEPPEKCPNCGSPKEKYVAYTAEENPLHLPYGQKVSITAEVMVNGFFDAYESLAPFIYNLPAGQRVGLHKHPTTDELFYIIKGKFKFKVGDDELIASPGDLVRGRMDIPHSFENISDEPGVFLSVKGPKPVDFVKLE